MLGSHLKTVTLVKDKASMRGITERGIDKNTEDTRELPKGSQASMETPIPMIFTSKNDEIRFSNTKLAKLVAQRSHQDESPSGSQSPRNRSIDDFIL